MALDEDSVTTIKAALELAVKLHNNINNELAAEVLGQRQASLMARYALAITGVLITGQLSSQLSVDEHATLLARAHELVRFVHTTNVIAVAHDGTERNTTC